MKSNKKIETFKLTDTTNKQYKTVRVKTLVLIALYLITITAGIAAGWQLRGFDNTRITKHAEQMVQTSKISQ